MFMQINRKLSFKIFILFLAFFLPSCAARDIYNAYEDHKESELELQLAKESGGKMDVFSVLKYQQSYYYEKETFASNFDDLGIGVVSQKYYDVEIVEADEKKAIIIAKSKENGLRSFAGIIEYNSDAEYESDQYKTLRCVTSEPATSIELPIDAETCGNGSEPL